MLPVCWCGNEHLEAWNDDYTRCPSCETLVDRRAEGVSSLVMDDGASLYDDSYWFNKMMGLYRAMGCNSMDDVILLHYRERAAHWMQYILSHIPLGSRVLEMGCGLGTLTKWLADFGYDAEATELSPGWRDYLRGKLGITVHAPSAIGHDGILYDAIILMDVLEHLSDPLAEMEKIGAMLQPEGVLVLQLPEYPAEVPYDDLVARQHPFINMLLPGEHVLLYSRRAVTTLLNRFGFHAIRRHPNIFPTDMFLFASRGPLPVFSPEAVERMCMANPRGVTAYAALKNAQKMSEANIACAARLRHMEASFASLTARAPR